MKQGIAAFGNDKNTEKSILSPNLFGVIYTSRPNRGIVKTLQQNRLKRVCHFLKQTEVDCRFHRIFFAVIT